MKSIAFIDTEIDQRSQKIVDIGGIKWDGGSYHSNSIDGFKRFLNGTEFLCGHNIINHDLTDRFQKSSRLEICSQIIKDFEATNPKIKYKSDLDIFIHESKLEDFRFISPGHCLGDIPGGSGFASSSVDSV
jgi:ATP-dependent DNA helicase RecQ